MRFKSKKGIHFFHLLLVLPAPSRSAKLFSCSQTEWRLPAAFSLKPCCESIRPEARARIDLAWLWPSQKPLGGKVSAGCSMNRGHRIPWHHLDILIDNIYRRHMTHRFTIKGWMWIVDLSLLSSVSHIYQTIWYIYTGIQCIQFALWMGNLRPSFNGTCRHRIHFHTQGKLYVLLKGRKNH